jgi:hydroxyacylglutathione hydrolase
MRCFINFSLSGFSNSYLIGPDNGGDAIVIDPGEMNVKFLKLIEYTDLYVRHILVTHNHKPHINGIRTLLKIYDADIYSASDNINGHKSNLIKAGDILTLSDIKIDVLEFSEHSQDSLVYLIGKMLFTGDTLSAGNLGDDEKKDTIKIIRKSVSEKIKNFDNSTLVFPGHGPPSTIRAEKEFNPELLQALE